MEPHGKDKAAATDANLVNPVVLLGPQGPDDLEPHLVSHDGVLCDGRQCQDKSECIQGPRYHCSVCENVDLCSICIRDPNHGHSRTHGFLECLARSRFMKTDGMTQPERDACNELVRQGKATDLSQSLAEIAHQIGATRWNERTLSGTKPSDEDTHVNFYSIDEKAKVTVTTIPASAQRSTNSLMDWLTGRLTLYPYPRDQFHEDAMAGIPCTRVIDLQPGRGDDALICSLRPIRLTEGLNYEALSYTWKETAYERAHALSFGKSHQIALKTMTDCLHPVYVDNEHVVQISVGLRDALLRYRHPEEVRTLWVDQICINQSSLSERSFQVSLMARIYNLTSRVVVWTGDEDQHTQSAFELIEQLAHRCNCFERLLPTPDEVNADPDLDLPPVGAEEWVALLELFKRPVFGRGWVIQEIVVARDVAVRCGEYETEFWKVGAVATLLVQPAWILSPFYQETTARSVRGLMPRPDHAAIIFGLRRSVHLREAMSITELLQRTQLFETSDPRDRMFALFNVAGIGHERRHRLPLPDYSKPIESICTDLTRYIINTDQSLDFLVAAGTCRHSFTDLPSWAVDWTVGGNINYAPTFSEGIPFTAAHDSDALLVFPDASDDTVLATSSFKCMIVATTGLSKRTPSFLGRSGRLVQWTAMAAQADDLYPNGQDSSTAFARTLVGDSMSAWRQSPVSDEYLFYVAAFILATIDSETPDGVSSEDHPILAGLHGRLVKETKFTTAADKMLNDVSTQVTLCTAQRCFFVTECGHFGLGPVGMEAGDEVHIISGGKTPFVLRKVVGSGEEGGDACRTLLGTAYVHGIMHGEALARDDFSWDQLLIV